MTNDEQLNPGAAPHPPRKPLRLLCATALWLAALPALAQTAPIPSSVPPATASESAVAAEKAATRSRADANGIVGDMTAEYYAQRASAGLILSEAINISADAMGSPLTPGLYNDAQLAAWQKITAAVHEKGGLIYAKL